MPSWKWLRSDGCGGVIEYIEMDLTLTGMAYGGEAFGRAEDGRMVFVPFALPGEHVHVRLTEVHKRWARGQPLEWMTTSPQRITPRCAHFGICGGCHYQHLPYREQLLVKEDVVREQLSRIGGLPTDTVQSIIPSPQEWAYRNRITFQVDSQGSLGFMRQDGEGVFAAQECHLPLPELNALWPDISLEKQSGVLKVGLRIGTEGRPMVLLYGEGKPELETSVEIPASLIWLSDAGTRVLAGEQALHFEIQGHRFRISPNSFFQVNTALVAELVSLALGMLSVEPGETILELYAGAGLFTRFLVEAGALVLAAEESPSACADFLINLDDAPEVDLIAEPVEVALRGLHIQPDAALLDPPRSGLSKPAREALLHLAPERIVYVSCDPATLARDGKALSQDGYLLERLTPIDLFPQTFHIETVSSWRRR